MTNNLTVTNSVTPIRPSRRATRYGQIRAEVALKMYRWLAGDAASVSMDLLTSMTSDEDDFMRRSVMNSLFRLEAEYLSEEMIALINCLSRCRSEVTT